MFPFLTFAFVVSYLVLLQQCDEKHTKNYNAKSVALIVVVIISTASHIIFVLYGLQSALLFCSSVAACF